MVSFLCHSCGDIVKKPKLDQHRGRCHAGFDCIDCSTTFNTPAEYKHHTSCISEAEKYQKSLYRGPSGKKANKYHAQDIPQIEPVPRVQDTENEDKESPKRASPPQAEVPKEKKKGKKAKRVNEVIEDPAEHAQGPQSVAQPSLENDREGERKGKGEEKVKKKRKRSDTSVTVGVDGNGSGGGEEQERKKKKQRKGHKRDNDDS